MFDPGYNSLTSVDLGARRVVRSGHGGRVVALRLVAQLRSGSLVFGNGRRTEDRLLFLLDRPLLVKDSLHVVPMLVTWMKYRVGQSQCVCSH